MHDRRTTAAARPAVTGRAGSGLLSTGGTPGRRLDSRARTVLLDQDAILAKDLPDFADPHHARLARGAAAALHRLARAGFGAAVIGNQPGVAMGRFALRDLDVVQDRLAHLLAGAEVPLRGFFACPHLPTGRVAEYARACDCRKPGDGLVRRALRELDLAAATTWVVGDSWADVAAGRGAGCRTLLVGPEWRYAELLPPGRRPDLAAPDLESGIAAMLDRLESQARSGEPDRPRPAGPLPPPGRTVRAAHGRSDRP